MFTPKLIRTVSFLGNSVPKHSSILRLFSSSNLKNTKMEAASERGFEYHYVVEEKAVS